MILNEKRGRYASGRPNRVQHDSLMSHLTQSAELSLTKNLARWLRTTSFSRAPSCNRTSRENASFRWLARSFQGRSRSGGCEKWEYEKAILQTSLEIMQGLSSLTLGHVLPRTKEVVDSAFPEFLGVDTVSDTPSTADIEFPSPRAAF